MQVAGALEPPPVQGAISNPVARPAEPSKSGRLSPGALPSPEPDRGCPPLPFHVSLLRGQPRAWASGPGARKKSRKHRGRAAPLPAQNSPQPGPPRIPPGPRGAGRGGGPGYVAGRPAEWDRVGARAGPAVGRPACGSPSGSLGSLGCALRPDDGELLEFPAAGERGRPGEPAQRSSGRGAEPPDPRTRLRRSGGCGRFPRPVPDLPPGRGRRLPSPAAPSGLAGVQARPSRPGRRTGARCRRRPSPSRLVSLSARHLCKSHQPCGLLGRGRGRRRRHRGRPGSSRGSGGKTRERIPPAARPAPPARAEPSKGSPVGGRRGSPLSASPPSRNDRASGRRTAGNILDRFPSARSSLL